MGTTVRDVNRAFRAKKMEIQLPYPEGWEVKDLQILEKKGSWISYDGGLIGQGREAAKQYLMENPEVTEKITKEIYGKVQVVGGSSLGHLEDKEAVTDE